MKLSISLSSEDVEVLDRFVEESGLTSRSAGIQRAIRRLSEPALAAAYAEAFQEWARSEDSHLWAGTTGDGLASEAW